MAALDHRWDIETSMHASARIFDFLQPPDPGR